MATGEGDLLIVFRIRCEMLVCRWFGHRWLPQNSREVKCGRVRLAEPSQVIEISAVQGLHHCYLPKAA